MGKNLDAELAEVAGIDDDAPVEAGDESADGSFGQRPATAKKKSNYGLLAALVVMAGAIVGLFAFGFTDAAVYSMPVDQYLSEGIKHKGRRVRLEGELVPNSLKKRDKPCEYRFHIYGASKKERLEVRFPQCIVPDTFRDVPQGGVMVTVEGRKADKAFFEATLIMAKCSSKYDPEKHEMKPQAAADIN